MGRLPIKNVSGWFLLFFKNFVYYSGTSSLGHLYSRVTSIFYLLPLLKGHLYISGERDTFL